METDGERRRGASGGLRRVVLGLLTAGGLACGVADESKLPPDIQDPATLKTPGGAVARYFGALATLPEALDHYLTTTGILTDELAANAAPLGVAGSYTGIDSRTNLDGFAADYSALHRVRGQAREARGFLQAYAPDSSPALAGHLYALEGYAEVLLADLFCSGIPLSTVDFDGDYTLAPGSSTTDVYRHAVALFDTALTLVGDSARFQAFAAVARGRALLALGRYAEAAAAVASVPDDYAYQVQFTPKGVPGPRLLAGFLDPVIGYRKVPSTPGMADGEGGNGLPYRTSNDPRAPAKLEGQDVLFHNYYFPFKYPESGAVTLTVASGVEARLIEAEALLQANPEDGQWLVKLNALRQTVGLTDTTDPGVDGRIDLLFRERAFWLYLTGHRQGDLRRLVRAYFRDPESTYPTGSYPGAGGAYGIEVAAPVPESEKTLNPQYTGCFNRNP